MKKLNEIIGTVEYDGLICGSEPATDVFSVTIRKGTTEETLKRGTVLALSTGTAGDGKMVVLGSTARSNETLTANCILADDVTVGTAADVVVDAYRAGKFARNKLIAKAEYTIKDADVEALRNGGIFLDTAIAY